MSDNDCVLGINRRLEVVRRKGHLSGGGELLFLDPRRSLVLRATCPKMIVIARLLREKFDLRFTLIARNAPDIEIRYAEAGVFQVN